MSKTKSIDDSSGEDPGGGRGGDEKAECCAEVERCLRADFENRFLKIENDIQINESKLWKSVEELKQCLILKTVKLKRTKLLVN